MHLHSLTVGASVMWVTGQPKLWRYWVAKVVKSSAERCVHLSRLDVFRSHRHLRARYASHGNAFFNLLSLKYLSSIVFSVSFIPFRPARVFAYFQESAPYFPAWTHCWIWWRHPHSSCNVQKTASPSWTSWMSPWCVHTASWSHTIFP